MAVKKKAKTSSRKPVHGFRCSEDLWGSWVALCSKREIRPGAGIRLLIKNEVRKARNDGELQDG